MTDAQTGETLIGANVVIKDPYKGAMADIDGNYSPRDLRQEPIRSLAASLATLPSPNL